MIDIIKNALKEAEIKTWRINEKKRAHGGSFLYSPQAGYAPHQGYP